MASPIRRKFTAADLKLFRVDLEINAKLGSSAKFEVINDVDFYRLPIGNNGTSNSVLTLTITEFNSRQSQKKFG